MVTVNTPIRPTKGKPARQMGSVGQNRNNVVKTRAGRVSKKRGSCVMLEDELSLAPKLIEDIESDAVAAVVPSPTIESGIAMSGLEPCRPAVVTS